MRSSISGDVLKQRILDWSWTVTARVQTQASAEEHRPATLNMTSGFFCSPRVSQVSLAGRERVSRFPAMRRRHLPLCHGEFHHGNVHGCWRAPQGLVQFTLTSKQGGRT